MDFGIFAYNSRTRIIDIRCFRSNQFHHLSLNIYIYILFSIPSITTTSFPRLRMKKIPFSFFFFFYNSCTTQQQQRGSNPRWFSICKFNSTVISRFLSPPPPLFIPKYLPIPHFYLYNISRNLFPQKLNKNLF